MDLLKYINKNLKAEDELIFFAGSFNPWHDGHEACLQLMGNNKKILVLPDHNPYKEMTVSHFTDIAYIKETLEKYPNTYLYTGFFDAHKKNPTIHWLYESKQAFKTKKLSLLMGFDTFMGVDKWIQAHDLLNILDNIYVVSRLDNPEQKSKQGHLLKSINPDLNMVFLGEHPYEDLSSTLLRENKSPK